VSKKPETIFGERVDRDLKEAFGSHVWIENIQQVGKRGTPDRLICLKGKFIAIELKIEDGQADKLQVLKLLEIKEAGGIGLIVRPSTWNVALDELKQVYASL
jgi:hypothetical protein